MKPGLDSEVKNVVLEDKGENLFEQSGFRWRQQVILLGVAEQDLVAGRVEACGRGDAFLPWDFRVEGLYVR